MQFTSVRSTLALLLAAFSVTVVGCGGDADAGDGVAIVATSQVSEITATNDESSTTTTSNGRGGSSTAASETDDTELPGDRFTIGPTEGSTLDVVGVRYDDELNFRTRPDPSAPIVDSVAPQTARPLVISAGEGRLLERSAWWKVTVDGTEAWANVSYLGMLGADDDVLGDLTSSLASTTAPSIDELIEEIAASRASGPVPRVEKVTQVEGADADGAQVLVDVIGIGDDALKGERLLLTFDVDGGTYELVGAERTIICGRGVTGGACV